MNQIRGTLSSCVRDGNLNVHVATPGRDQTGLPLHFSKLVSKHLKGEWSVWDTLQYVSGEGLVVLDPRLTHQGRIRSEPFDERVFVEVQDGALISAVCEDFDFQIIEGLHFESSRIQSAASFKDVTSQSIFPKA